MDKKIANALVAIVVVLSAIAIYYIYTVNFTSAINRILLGILAMVLAGTVIQRSKGLVGGYGAYMVGGKRGIATVDGLAKRHNTFWHSMAIWGLVLGFGLLSYPLIRRKIDRLYIFGIASLIFMYLFVFPYLIVPLQFINLPQLQAFGYASSVASSSPFALHIALSPIYIVTSIITLVVGFAGYTFALLVYNMGLILYGAGQFITGLVHGVTNTAPLSSQMSGVAPLIPGIDLPLLPGILSLAILLVIHEFSHGVLARMFKVKLKSIGVLLLGIIPIGAYVEPDEKMVAKLEGIKQTKIISAGISANFIAAFVFFLLTLGVVYVVAPHFYSYGVNIASVLPNYPANGIIPVGAQVLSWNNVPVNSLENVSAAGLLDVPNETVTVATDKGTYAIMAVASPTNSTHGIIGVQLGYGALVKTPVAKVVYFLFTLFSLSMMLNFLVAIVNLLPVPIFDGWRIYKINIKNAKIVKALTLLVVISLLINVIPLFFNL
ncbi:MAG TPA: M50 family metallopeptidase [Candidatus Baltobacteraceae bacterium]|nr:M50 family metallopeptidase [Candidatus Baltobacteraceae bacterium]